MAKDDCCYKCTNRRVGCHASCPDYALFKEKLSEMRMAKYKKKAVECALIDHDITSKMHNKRGRNTK